KDPEGPGSDFRARGGGGGNQAGDRPLAGPHQVAVGGLAYREPVVIEVVDPSGHLRIGGWRGGRRGRRGANPPTHKEDQGGSQSRARPCHVRYPAGKCLVWGKVTPFLPRRQERFPPNFPGKPGLRPGGRLTFRPV